MGLNSKDKLLLQIHYVYESNVSIQNRRDSKNGRISTWTNWQKEDKIQRFLNP